MIYNALNLKKKLKSLKIAIFGPYIDIFVKIVKRE